MGLLKNLLDSTESKNKNSMKSALFLLGLLGLAAAKELSTTVDDTRIYFDYDSFERGGEDVGGTHSSSLFLLQLSNVNGDKIGFGSESCQEYSEDGERIPIVTPNNGNVDFIDLDEFSSELSITTSSSS